MEALFTALAGAEGPVLLWVQQALRGPLDGLVSFYTRLGNAGALWIALAVVLLLFPRTRRAGAAVALALLLSLLLTNVMLKNLVQRPRPWLAVEGLVALVRENDPNSFPSGHSSAAFAAATACLWALPERCEKWKALLIVLAACMALSRLYVGVHYPTDVVCGVLVGTLCGALGWRLEQFLEKRTGRRL